MNIQPNVFETYELFTPKVTFAKNVDVHGIFRTKAHVHKVIPLSNKIQKHQKKSGLSIQDPEKRQALWRPRDVYESERKRVERRARFALAKKSKSITKENLTKYIKKTNLKKETFSRLEMIDFLKSVNPDLPDNTKNQALKAAMEKLNTPRETSFNRRDPQFNVEIEEDGTFVVTHSAIPAETLAVYSLARKLEEDLFIGDISEIEIALQRQERNCLAIIQGNQYEPEMGGYVIFLHTVSNPIIRYHFYLHEDDGKATVSLVDDPDEPETYNSIFEFLSTLPATTFIRQMERLPR